MIETTENKLVYNPSGSNVYAFYLPFFSASDIHCYVYRNGQESELVSGTAFTVEQKDDYSHGADITLLAALPIDSKLVITREIPITQNVSLPEYGKLPSGPLEDQLDRMIMICQQLKESVARSFLRPHGMMDVDAEEFYDSVKTVSEHGAEWAETIRNGIANHNADSVAHEDIRAKIEVLGDHVFNPKDFNDDLEEAVAAANLHARTSGGAVVYVPEGVWEITSPLIVETGVSLIGAGQSRALIRKTAAGGTSADELPGRETGNVYVIGPAVPSRDAVIILSGRRGEGSTTTEQQNCAFVRISDLAIEGAADYGILGVKYVKHAVIARVTIEGGSIGGVSKAEHFVCGMLFPRLWNSEVSFCRAISCTCGFALNMGTSLTYRGNYANRCTRSGHYIYDYTYSVFENCACDNLNVSSVDEDYTKGLAACYRFRQLRGCTVRSCGAEYNNGTFMRAEVCRSSVFSACYCIMPFSEYVAPEENPVHVALLYLGGEAMLYCRFENIIAQRIYEPADNDSASYHHDFYIEPAASPNTYLATGTEVHNVIAERNTGSASSTPWGNRSASPGGDLWGPVEDVSESRTFVGRGVSEFSVTKGSMDYHMQQRYGTSYMRIWGCFDATVTYTEDEDETTTTYVLPSGFVTADAVLPVQKIKIATNLLSLECFKLNPENSNGLMFKADGTIYTPESGTHITFVYDGYYKINA